MKKELNLSAAAKQMEPLLSDIKDEQMSELTNASLFHPSRWCSKKGLVAAFCIKKY